MRRGGRPEGGVRRGRPGLARRLHGVQDSVATPGPAGRRVRTRQPPFTQDTGGASFLMFVKRLAVAAVAVGAVGIVAIEDVADAVGRASHRTKNSPPLEGR